MKKLLNKTFFYAAIASLCLGCASNLKVYEMGLDGKASEVEGIPFHSEVIVKIVKTISYKVVENTLVNKNEDEKKLIKEICDYSEPTESFTKLPIGTLYYINIEAADLGKSEFAVDFDAGILKSVRMNSDPKIPENIEAASKLLASASSAAKTIAMDAYNVKLDNNLDVNEQKKSIPLIDDLKGKHCIKDSEKVELANPPVVKIK